MASNLSARVYRQLPAVLNGVRLACACVATLISGIWIALTFNHLTRVGITTTSDIVGDAPSVGWAGSNLLFAISLTLWAGARANSRLVSAFQSSAGATIALLALIVPIEGTRDLEFSSPDRHCIRTGCWPMGVQDFLAISPGVIAALALLAQSVLVHRWPWWARAVIPVAVHVIATATQVTLWPHTIVPYLTRNPSQ